MGILSAVSALQILVWGIAQAAGFDSSSQTQASAIAVLSSMVTMGIMAAMFLTARSHNGYASLYDMISGTRLRVRRAERARRVATATASPEETAEGFSGEHIGPFTVVAAIGTAGAGRLLAGYDPVLRRRVWIRTVPPGTRPIAPARRDVSRVARLHWLTGRRSATENWDAFEAPSGGPLLKRNEASLDWSAAKVVFADLLHEFAAVTEESLPPLRLDRLWMRADGRTVLLDFEAPGVQASSSSAEATPMELLAAVAGRVTMPGAFSKDSRLPLSACRLLRRWSREAPRSLEEAQAQLREATASPERVSRWRRAVPFAMAALPVLLIGASAANLVLSNPPRMLTPQEFEVLDLLTVLQMDVPSPEYRVAIETYLAGRHGAVLRDTSLWSNREMWNGRFPAMGRVASDIVTRYPSVTTEELALSRHSIQRLSSRLLLPPKVVNVSPIVTLTNVMTAFCSLVVLFCSIVSSIAVPGGVATRMIGLAVVTRDGIEISRWRSLARTLIAWLPILVWLVLFTWSQAGRPFGPVYTVPLLSISLAFGTMIAGVAWMIAAADRGLHDCIARTWVVPR